MMFVFSLMGVNFFARTFFFDGDGRWVPPERRAEVCPADQATSAGISSCTPRSHFDTFLWAFVTIFQILSGENWNEVMYDSIRATSWMACFYFFIVVCAGNFLILNLFLAIL